jgi:hypothetical protein
LKTLPSKLLFFNQQSKINNQQFSYLRHGDRSGQWLIASSAQAVDLPA